MWTVTVHNPNQEGGSMFTQTSRPRIKHIDTFIVARVQPRTSKGITDLLLLNLINARRILSI